MKSPKYDMLEAAYLFYYATDVAFQPNADESGAVKKRLIDLIGDALIIADQVSFCIFLQINFEPLACFIQAGFDVFNCLTLMDNCEFIHDLKVRLPYILQFT